jgi:hypothetical protein
VVLLEDLQWTDAASWEYFVEVFLSEAESRQSNGLFILEAACPEWRPPAEVERSEGVPYFAQGCRQCAIQSDLHLGTGCSCVSVGFIAVDNDGNSSGIIMRPLTLQLSAPSLQRHTAGRGETSHDCAEAMACSKQDSRSGNSVC